MPFERTIWLAPDYADIIGDKEKGRATQGDAPQNNYHRGARPERNEIADNAANDYAKCCNTERLDASQWSGPNMFHAAFGLPVCGPLPQVTIRCPYV